MRYIDRSTGKKLIFKSKAEYEKFRQEVLVPATRDRRRLPSGVSVKARHDRWGKPKSAVRNWRKPVSRVKVPVPDGHIRQKFSLIHPSRGRPMQFDGCAHMWNTHFSGHNDLEYILSLDSDDAYNYMEIITKVVGEYPLMVVSNPNRSVVDAMNNGAAKSTGDVLIYVSDDFECPPNWDLEIQKYARRANKVGKEWVLEVNDGIQPDYATSVQTILILSRAYYKRFGYLYYPEYFSVWGDNDFTDRARLLKANIPAWDLVFKHDHPVAGCRPTDATYQRENSQKAWDEGMALYERRKKEKFGLASV